MTRLGERFIYGEFYKQMRRLHFVTLNDLLRNCFFLFKSYMMQRQNQRKQDAAPFVKIEHDSFGKKAEEISQHLNDVLV